LSPSKNLATGDSPGTESLIAVPLPATTYAARNSNPELQSPEADRQAGHLRHGAGGAAPHLRPPPPTPLPQGQARRARRRGLILATPDVLVLTPGARLLGSALRRRAIPGRGGAAALLRPVLAGRCTPACAEAVRPCCIYLALSRALW
jgi:hypothetical protein